MDFLRYQYGQSSRLAYTTLLFDKALRENHGRRDDGSHGTNEEESARALGDFG